MLDDPQAKRGQVEHLANLDLGDQRTGKLATAAAAAVGDMDHDLVGVGDLRQVRPRGARLLAGPAPATIATRGTGGLGQAIRGRRLEEFEESLPSRRSSSATRACKVAIRRACSALAARSSTMTAAWTATVASSSGSGEQIAASRTPNGHARLPKGRTAQLPHQPPARQLVTARSRGRTCRSPTRTVIEAAG
jgi:hypothetical protein